ncbi:hypothetical protein I3842_03G073800 [Carya illinoinensis]|uniref:Amine oxidase domain-containing protein n=1 Tax=Carya illinoinensis TaxID=32201 RepID=A0A922JU85_CARIL|nr:hypothetical protein I3842_03G073800 [Carya illinoinensis]
MGASWLHGVCNENPLAPLICGLGLTLYRTSGDDSVLYDHDLESYTLYDVEGHQVPQQMVIEGGETFKRILKETRKVRDEHTNDIYVLQAISIVLDRLPELRMEAWFAADADMISLKSWDQESAEHVLSCGYGLMVQGYDPLIKALAKDIDIRLNNRGMLFGSTVPLHIGGPIYSLYNGRMSFPSLQTLSWRSNPRLLARCQESLLDKLTRPTTGGMNFLADDAILTVPLGVLKAKLIEFEPKLPDWKVSAISDLGVGNEIKIALLFDTVFWPNVELLGIVAPSSYACGYFLNLNKATGHPVLIYMVAGRFVYDLEKLSDESAANFVMSQLKKMFPNATKLIQYLVSRWGINMNSIGCYSYDLVGKPEDVYQRLRAPLGNLFFAGEAVTYSAGVVVVENCRRYLLNKLSNMEKLQLISIRNEILKDAIPLQISRM